MRPENHRSDAQPDLPHPTQSHPSGTPWGDVVGVPPHHKKKSKRPGQRNRNGKGERLLHRLLKGLKVTPEHPWRQHADLIRECDGILDATCAGFTVHLGDGIREMEFTGGLTEEHYCYFAPRLDERDKADLARAVLQNKKRRSYLDWETAWSLLGIKYGKQGDDWLPQQIATMGFATIADEIEESLSKYWKDNPKPRFDRSSGLPLNRDAKVKPSWNDETRSLWVGDMLIKTLTKPARHQVRVFQAFQEEGWPRRILDPLPPNAKVYTIVGLNRNHVNPGILQFGKDGTGEGIRWHFLDEPFTS